MSHRPDHPLFRKKRPPRKPPIGAFLLVVFLLAGGGIAAFLWKMGALDELMQVAWFRQETPVQVVPPQRHRQFEFVSWLGTSPHPQKTAVDVGAADSPWKAVFVLYEKVSETLLAYSPRTFPGGVRLRHVFVGGDGGLVLDLALGTPDGSAVSLSEEERLLRHLGATAMGCFDDASSVRFIVNGRSQRVFLRHLAFDIAYPREFFL